VGVVTAILGGPFFCFLLMHRKNTSNCNSGLGPVVRLWARSRVEGDLVSNPPGGVRGHSRTQRFGQNHAPFGPHRHSPSIGRIDRDLRRPSGGPQFQESCQKDGRRFTKRRGALSFFLRGSGSHGALPPPEEVADGQPRGCFVVRRAMEITETVELAGRLITAVSGGRNSG